MKVAHLICTYPPYKGGMGNSVYHLARSLREQGCEATVITPLYSGIKADNTALRLKPLLESGNAAILPQLFFKLKKFDVIHLHYPFYGTHLSVLLSSMLWRNKLVLHYHMDTDAPGLRGLVFKFNRLLIEPLLLRRAKVIIGSSIDYLENSFISAYVRNNPEKIIGIPFGARDDLFESVEGITKNRSMLFVSALDKAHYFKGLSVLFESLAAIKKTSGLSGWILEIVGDGDLKEEYVEMCAKLDILESVVFLGKINDEELKDKFRHSGFLVLPSTTRGEAFGIVLIEAMVSGTPVVASNLPGVRSVFKNGEHGLLIEPGDSQSLTAAIKKMITDDTFRIQAGQTAREYAVENYSQKKMGERVIMAYAKLLQK